MEVAAAGLNTRPPGITAGWVVCQSLPAARIYLHWTSLMSFICHLWDLKVAAVAARGDKGMTWGASLLSYLPFLSSPSLTGGWKENSPVRGGGEGKMEDKKDAFVSLATSSTSLPLTAH